jgi:imidazolonepropionase-like amidohydrolase
MVLYCGFLILFFLYRCLRIENRKGTLRPGADADLVVLDRDGYVLSTYVKGRKVWSGAVAGGHPD